MINKTSIDLNQHTAHILSVAFSPDTTKILTGSWDNTAKLWDLEGKVLVNIQHEAQVTHASFSRDGSNILTVSYDFQVKLWDSQGNFLASLNKKRLLFQSCQKKKKKAWGSRILISIKGKKIRSKFKIQNRP